MILGNYKICVIYSKIYQKEVVKLNVLLFSINTSTIHRVLISGFLVEVLVRSLGCRLSAGSPEDFVFSHLSFSPRTVSFVRSCNQRLSDKVQVCILFLYQK
jgi:hypothetical protein